MNKFLLGVVASIFLILSPIMVSADDHQVELDNYTATGTPIAGFSRPPGAGMIMDGGGSSGSGGEGGGSGGPNSGEIEGCSNSDAFNRERAGSAAANREYSDCLSEAGGNPFSIVDCGQQFAAGTIWVYTWPDGSSSTFEIGAIMAINSAIEQSCDE